MALTSIWLDHWRRSPDQLVLIDSPEGHSWRASQLDQVSAGLATMFARRGVRAGDRVVLTAPASAGTAATFVALLRLGVEVVAVNPASTAAEIEHVCRLTEPVLAVVGQSPAVPDWPVPTVDVAGIRGQWRAAGQPVDSIGLDCAAESDSALICFTSGTTGKPKAVPLTHANLAAGTRALVSAWGWTRTDVLISALPLFHVHGLVVALCTTFTAGAAIVVEQRFEPALLAEDCADHNGTMVFGVPTMWWRIAEEGAAAQLRGLRLAVSGSAPLDPALCLRLAGELGQIPVERYGMSETVILTSNPVDGIRKPGSVGLPLPGVELRIADDGVVEVTGPSVFSGYLGEGSRDDFTDDGWFRTGDLGRVDQDGYLYLGGRRADTIITGGHNVAPSEVEAVIGGQPGVREVAVVGIADPRWGQIVTAFVVPETSTHPDTDQLAEACAEQLSDYKCPRRWEVRNALPRNAMGKINRAALRASD